MAEVIIKINYLKDESLDSWMDDLKIAHYTRKEMNFGVLGTALTEGLSIGYDVESGWFCDMVVSCKEL